ncbi:Hypothetical_protein [Hexamita inflata]|uniref:Hypothetical_protein n=1 Tax=Hexamita inflata TaxID=28002 RepID=A0AA86RA95_9EUKA|nr:Hypothetical protein HINF_LOCUS45328 [Hexamita inflata]CAI9972442.1 Hypothetical protein HINF_LOCUS60087 [Hexamita inflata]
MNCKQFNLTPRSFLDVASTLFDQPLPCYSHAFIVASIMQLPEPRFIKLISELAFTLNLSNYDLLSYFNCTVVPTYLFNNQRLSETSNEQQTHVFYSSIQEQTSFKSIYEQVEKKKKTEKKPSLIEAIAQITGNGDKSLTNPQTNELLQQLVKSYGKKAVMDWLANITGMNKVEMQKHIYLLSSLSKPKAMNSD